MSDFFWMLLTRGTENGERGTGNGEWEMEIENGEWEIKNGKLDIFTLTFSGYNVNIFF